VVRRTPTNRQNSSLKPAGADGSLRGQGTTATRLCQVEVEPGERLTLGALGGIEWRAYKAESFIQNVPESVKKRSDRRIRGGVFGDVFLNESGSMKLTVDGEVRNNESNVALDASDPDHAYDYDNLSYTQYLVTGGLEVSFGQGQHGFRHVGSMLGALLRGHEAKFLELAEKRCLVNPELSSGGRTVVAVAVERS